MKKSELFIFLGIAFMILILFKNSASNYLSFIKNLIVIITIMLFQFFERSAIHKDKLNPKLKKNFYYCDMIFSPILNAINKYIKPVTVGANLQLSLGSFIVVFILLIILIF